MAVESKPWTEEEIQFIRDAWATSSAGKIASALGRTRNAIIGKVHRMGLSAAVGKVRSNPETKPPRPARKRRREAPIKIDAPSLPVCEIVPPPIAHVEISRGVHFSDVGANGCRWVIGNPEDLTCCGAPASHAGSAWCIHHRALVYVRPRKRDRSKLSKYYR